MLELNIVNCVFIFFKNKWHSNIHFLIIAESVCLGLWVNLTLLHLEKKLSLKGKCSYPESFWHSKE